MYCRAAIHFIKAICDMNDNNIYLDTYTPKKSICPFSNSFSEIEFF